MPVLTFACEEHGNFRKLVTTGKRKALCDRCRKWAEVVMAKPSAKVRVSIRTGERSDTLDDSELQIRMTGAAEEARRAGETARRNRAKAQEDLPEEVKEAAEANKEFRGELEAVIKAEPQEDLDEGGLKVWRKEAEHLDVMEKERGGSVEKRNDLA